MSQTLVIFTQDEHSLTLPLAIETVVGNRNFDNYIVFLIKDSFSIPRLLKNLVFLGPVKFAKVVCDNIFSPRTFPKASCRVIKISQKDFRSLDWFHHVAPNSFGLSINCPLKLNKDVIEKFNGNILNVHNSILPKYGGLMPMLRQIINEDLCFGSTLHVINENLDEGRIAFQYCLIDPNLHSPYQIWNQANKINRDLLVELKPEDYSNTTAMDMSKKSYYSIPGWPDVFKYFLLQQKRRLFAYFS